MRDTLALALIRADYCRAYASERSRLNKRWTKNGARALIGWALRSIRAGWRGLGAGDRAARTSDSNSPSH